MSDDTCSHRTEGSAENCPPGHDCAECEHYVEGPAMSSLDEYRKFSYVVQFGGHVDLEDVAVVREVFVKMEERADAAIEELESRLAALKAAAARLTELSSASWSDEALQAVEVLDELLGVREAT